MGLKRTWAACVIIAAAISANAAARTHISQDSIDSYHQALSEKNRPKAKALLHGLLIDRLTVGVDLSTLQQGDDTSIEGIRSAINLWNQSLGQPVFRMEPSSVTANIVVRLVNKVQGEGTDIQGCLQFQRNLTWNHIESTARVVGQVEIRDNLDDRYLTKSEVTRVMTHELGHLLGLDDSSDDTGVMADFIPGEGIKKPSAEELGSVTDFRKKLRAALDAR
ncbi:hypothetical protein BH11ARM1_BH11ARM1_18040 [soil metagenome]